MAVTEVTFAPLTCSLEEEGNIRRPRHVLYYAKETLETTSVRLGFRKSAAILTRQNSGDSQVVISFRCETLPPLSCRYDGST